MTLYVPGSRLSHHAFPSTATSGEEENDGCAGDDPAYVGASTSP